MKYRPEIDGLRAVAVIPVILFHAGFESFGGGYVGVDVFFVISGYLITTIILNDLETDSFSIACFYERRAKRILPALFLVTSLCVPFAWAMLEDREFAEFARSLAAVAVFASNFHFWAESNYFATAHEVQPLLHTWSLAVEEQYYIVYPLLLTLVWRTGRRYLWGALALLFVASITAAQVLVQHYPATVFFLLPFRAWELILGAFCAIHLKRRAGDPDTRVSALLSAIGALAIVIAVGMFDRHTPTPSVWTLVPTGGAALLILFAVPGTPLRQILASPPLVKIGLISYSAYLWHQPLFAFTRIASLEEPRTAVLLGLSVASLGLAWLSWKYVETPLRAAKVSRKRTLGTAAALAGIVFCAGAVGMAMPGRIGNGWANPRLSVDPDEIANYADRKFEQATESWALLRELAGDPNYLVYNNASDTESWYDENDKRANLLVVGNSHSKDLFNILWYNERVQQEFELARFGAQIGFLRSDHPFFDSPNYQESEVVVISSQMFHQRGDAAALESLVKRMWDDGKRVVLVKTVFEFPKYYNGAWTLFDRTYHEMIDQGETDPIAILNASNARHYQIFKTGETSIDFKTANSEMDRLAALYPQLIVLDRMEFICDDEQQMCFSANEDLENYFYGNGHNTVAGAKFFSKRLDEIGWLNRVYEQ